MATAAQDQWLAALGVSTLRAKSGPKSGAETPSQADAATVTLGKIPVPHISGESKDALVKAMRTIDRIQPSERAKGFFTIVTAEGTNQIAKAEADDIRGKTGAAFKRNISATKLKAEAAMDRYSEQKKTKADQWAVSAAVSFARKVASVERFEDPGPTLTKEVEAARAWIAAAAAAADANSFARAAEAFADAEAAAARAAGMTQVYVTGMIEGAEASLTMLEGMRDLAFIAEGALATVATAGVASGAIAASTTAFGAGIGMPGAATVIATAAPIAGSLATAATKVALGDKVDWGAVALDASLQFFIARFGGPATKGIAAAVTKRLAGKLAAESIARMGIEKMVQGLILQEGSTALSTVAESTYAALRGKDITWEQFFKTLLTRLTDPKGIAVAAVVTAINSGAEMKYRGSSGPTVNAQGEGNEAPANEPPPPFAAARKPVTEPANAASAIPGENTAAQPAAAGSSSAPRQRPSGGASKSAGPSAAQPAPAPARPGKPRPPQFKDTKRYALTDFDKETAGTGGIKSIERKAEPDALYGIAIEGELKDPIPRKNAPNYNQSDKIIDPEGPGLKPEEWEKAHLVGPATPVMEPRRAAPSRGSRSKRPMRAATARRAISLIVALRPLRVRRLRRITRSRSRRGRLLRPAAPSPSPICPPTPAGAGWPTTSSEETAVGALLIAIPLSAAFALFGGLFLQRGRRGPWRELWWRAGMRPSVIVATAARRLLRLGLVATALLVYLFLSLWLTALLADTAAMQAVDRFVDAHRLWLLVSGIPLGLLGFVLFLGSGLASAMAEGTPLSREELDDFYRAQGRRDPTGPGLGWRWQMGIDDGTVIATRDPVVAVTLADLKYAWRAGLLRRPPFPRRIAHLAGAVILLLGGGGAIFAIGSGLMRIWVVLWVLLAFGLIARALVKR